MKTIAEYVMQIDNETSGMKTSDRNLHTMKVFRQALEDMQKEHLSIIAQAKNLDEAYYRIEQNEIK